MDSDVSTDYTNNDLDFDKKETYPFGLLKND